VSRDGGRAQPTGAAGAGRRGAGALRLLDGLFELRAEGADAVADLPAAVAATRLLPTPAGLLAAARAWLGGAGRLRLQHDLHFTSDHGADQQRAGFEVLRAVVRPILKFIVMDGQGLDMPLVLVGERRSAGRCMAERAGKVSFRRLERRRRYPEEPLRGRE